MVFSEEIDGILGVGFYLGGVGINNWALDRCQCLGAINDLKLAKIPILGGDTFLDGRVNPKGDNWFCDRKDDESDEEYLERSVRRSVDFVCNPVYSEFKFILVPETVNDGIHFIDSSSVIF